MKFQKTITKCGAPLFLYEMPYLGSVALAVLVNAGTRDERARESGIAHALEHMLFQGNVNDPDSQTITGKIETIGGFLNAFTSNELTCYLRMVPDDKLHVGVDSLASQVLTSLFRESNIKTEMQNIVQEIKMCNDDPGDVCQDLFDTLIFGNHPLGKKTLGTKESVTGFTRNDFVKFVSDFYHAANFTFIAVGNTTLAEAEKAFDSAFAAPVVPVQKNVRIPKALTRKASTKTNMREIEQANMILGVQLGDPLHADTRALVFYNAMIGGGMSTPLFQDVRDKRGLCYNIDSSVSRYTDAATFEVSIGCEPSRISEAIDAIHEVIERSCTAELFGRSRTQQLGVCKVGLFVDPMSILQLAVNDISRLGYPRSREDFLAVIEASTLAGVTEAVQRHLLNKNDYSYAYVIPHGTTL